MCIFIVFSPPDIVNKTKLNKVIQIYLCLGCAVPSSSEFRVTSPTDDVQVSPLCLSSRAGHSGLAQVKTESVHANDTDDSVLDTTDVAQFVRHVLISRNIGQRQFARSVLGLSQGTVSELLAKPKPWDRLSEKGRESYRRMYQWAVEQTGAAGLWLDSAQNGRSCLCPECT